MGETIRAIFGHYRHARGAPTRGTRFQGVVGSSTPMNHERRVDYVGLARKINREHADALDLLDAYDRGEARIIDGKLQRV